MRDISARVEKALQELARRSIPAGRNGAGEGDATLVFVAEKLIALAAGAALVMAPVSIALGGFGLPGSYGAATAIALTHLAIPFLALGWLSISRSAWKTAFMTVASWSALAGAMVAVSPLLALSSGLVLFAVAGFGASADRLRKLIAAEPGEEPAAEPRLPDATRIELTREGIVARVVGGHAGRVHLHRPFVDSIHLADRIAFLAALADVSKSRRGRAGLRLRVNLAAADEPQAFRPLRADLAASGELVSVRLAETEAEASQPEAGPTEVQKRFLATVSHELRTPLNSIIGFSDILKRDLFGALANERQREYVNLIHSSGVHLLNVVNSILDVSKINAGTYAIHREPFDLDAVAQECVSMLEPQAGAKGVKLERAATAPLGHADGDRRAIKQIAINLLSNAIKFTDAGGTVTMKTEARAGGFVLSVSDTGIGMSDADLAIIGAPFAQVDNAYTRHAEGTGLGLAVVTGLVQLHGGSLEVSSKPGEGTEVRVFIPESAECGPLPLQTGGESRNGRVVADRMTARIGNQTRANGSIVRLAG